MTGDSRQQTARARRKGWNAKILSRRAYFLILTTVAPLRLTNYGADPHFTDSGQYLHRKVFTCRRAVYKTVYKCNSIELSRVLFVLQRNTIKQSRRSNGYILYINKLVCTATICAIKRLKSNRLIFCESTG